MNFLEYSNKTQSNIIPKEEFEALVEETFGVIADNITKSLGPLGSSATILDGMMTEATKDGYAILMKYCFHNRYKKMIYNLIKAPCTRMNNTVGDGTTTAIALTNQLFARYKKDKDKLEGLYRLPRHFIEIWDSTIEAICKKVGEMSTPVDPTDYDTIYHIAYVTSNGNKDISDNIATTYKNAISPAIKQKDSPTNKSYISDVNGFEFPANLIDTIFVRNQDLTAEEKDIAVMIFDHKIETDIFTNLLIKVNDVYRAMNKKLLIIAPSYDGYMCDTVVEQYIKAQYRQYGSINLILAQYRQGDLSKYQLSDLSVILRCKVLNQGMVDGIMNLFTTNKKSIDEIIMESESEENQFNGMVGHVDEAMLSCNNGSIFNVYDIESDNRYQQTLDHARKELEVIKANIDYEKQSYAAKIHEANSRVLQLEMKNYIYYIGADSDLQKQITWDSVEDVIKCVRSAIKYGVVPGCQLSIIKACIDITKEIKQIYYADINNPTDEEYNSVPDSAKLELEILSIIYFACLDVYYRVLSGPDNMGTIKMIDRWQYTKEDEIDSLKAAAMSKATEIMNNSIENYQVFDLEDLDYNPNIITSTETDIMVLKAASELIKILISGNQCIFLDSEVNDSHQETVEAYV
jgi:chaperonin GroEL